MANAMIFGHLLEDLTDGVTVFREGVGKPMPLTSTDIDIEINSGLAVVVTTRKFSNSEDVPIEAILTMPVGFNAVVTGLSACIDGRKLNAVAKTRNAARDSYEASIDEGKMAILHEEALRGIHVLSVGQLAPGKEVDVELRMVVPLALSEGGPFLRLPMTSGQLYGSTPLQPVDDLITDAQVRHEATLTIRTDVGVPRLTGIGAVAQGASLDITLDRAIEIVLEGGRFGTLTGVSAQGHQVRIELRPQQSAEHHLKLAIVVDRSGSTSSNVGDGRETVLSAMRKGLADALSDTKEEDHIALWQFSNDCQRLGTGRGAEVLHLLKKLNQPGGGTRLGAAIRKVAASGIHDILVLTDGQTWDSLPSLASELDIRISAVLVGEASLDANIGHLCALTGGDLFYAPDAQVGACVRLAIASKRSSAAKREIELAEGRPKRVCLGMGGVEITASWSDAMDVGSSTDLGRFAAGLCLGQMETEAATALATAEGLCSHTTSLILVDDAGEASQGLSETRKVPLMMHSAAVDSAASMSEPRVLRRASDSESDVLRRRSAMVGRYAAGWSGPALSTPSKSSGRGMFRSFLDQGSNTEGTSVHPRSGFDLRELETIAQGIDWETQINPFLSGDYTGLLNEEIVMLDALAENATLAGVLKSAGLPHRLVLLAWLAKQFVTHSRAAQQFATKVFGQISDRGIVQEIQSLIVQDKG